MGAHLVNVDGKLKFQSDKFPTTPAGKVPLSQSDPAAQDLLWTYAQRRRAGSHGSKEVDAEFADDVETALRGEGFEPPPAMDLWAAVALCHGYSELARKAVSLGERVFFRLCCDTAEQAVVAAGGKVDRTGPAPILVLGEKAPYVRFTAGDIEAMRVAVAAFDAENALGTVGTEGER